MCHSCQDNEHQAPENLPSLLESSYWWHLKASLPGFTREAPQIEEKKMNSALGVRGQFYKQKSPALSKISSKIQAGPSYQALPTTCSQWLHPSHTGPIHSSWPTLAVTHFLVMIPPKLSALSSGLVEWSQRELEVWCLICIFTWSSQDSWTLYNWVNALSFSVSHTWSQSSLLSSLILTSLPEPHLPYQLLYSVQNGYEGSSGGSSQRDKANQQDPEPPLSRSMHKG